MKKITDQFCVIDIETRGLSARPESFVFGCLYGNEGKFRKVFYERETMVKYLLSKKNPYKYIFAHNGEFDFTILFDNIIRNLDNSALFVGSTFVKAKKDGKHFCNSLTVLKSGVEYLGDCLGMPKGKLDKKFIEGHKIINVTAADIEYCIRDCEIVYHFLQKMYDKVGKIKFTVASCAMEIFIKQFLKRPLKKNPLNEYYRLSYYGGRVECFRFGKIKPIHKYDVNSIYPDRCVKGYFPDFNKTKQGKNFGLPYFRNFILQNYEGCAEVTVEHMENFVGVLPFRRKTEIIYPYGIFKAWYNFNELRFALSTGLVKIKKVHNYVYSPRIIFTELREYMLHFFKAKNETEGAEKLLNKFLLNALTGKFAQKDYGEKTYFETTEKMNEFLLSVSQETKVTLHHFSDQRDDWMVEVFRERKNAKVNWNIPTISSYITSMARVYMLPFFLKYKKNICYTDTDSLVLTCPIEKKYISESLLGMFKKEADSEIEIIGNKHYNTLVDGKRVTHIKGVGKKFKIKKIKKGIHAGKQGFVFNRMIRTKEGLSQNKHAGMFLEVTKHMANNYTKRSIGKNNKTLTLKINNK